jgi:hypothetical protein
MPVTFGFVHNTRTEQVVFDIVDMEYPYNAIIGRGILNAFEAILHPANLCMKIPLEQGPIAVHGSQEAARKAEGNWTDSKAIHNIDGAEVCEKYKYKREKAASANQPKPMLLCEYIVEKKVLLGPQLSEEQEKTLIRFLFNNKDVFAWSVNDLCGVNIDVIEYSLNVDPSFRTRKQRLWKMSDDKAEGARNEVKSLLSAGVIREVKYPERLANTVMVKKANGKWRMCIAFTDINKACPKDEFPLPRIDSLVDAAASSELIVGAKAKTLPFAPGPRHLDAPTEVRRPTQVTLRPSHRKTKTHDEVPPSHVLTKAGGPRGLAAHHDRPRTEKRVTGPVCNGFSVMTVCNPPLWEYSRDNPGA